MITRCVNGMSWLQRPRRYHHPPFHRITFSAYFGVYSQTDVCICLKGCVLLLILRRRCFETCFGEVQLRGVGTLEGRSAGRIGTLATSGERAIDEQAW